MDSKLLKFQEIVDEVSSLASTNEKIEVISKYKNDPFVIEIIKMVYDPEITFGIKKIPIPEKFNSDITETVDDDFLAILSDLSHRRVVGNLASITVCDFLSDNLLVNPICVKIIRKKLDFGLGKQSIKKIFKNVFKPFSPMKGYEFGGYNSIPVNGFAQAKIDGVRNIAIVDRKNKTVSHYSFVGLPVKEFSIFNDELLKFADKYFNEYDSVVFDGEMAGSSWNKTISAKSFVNVNEEAKSELKYYIFHYIPYDDWINGHTELKNMYVARRIEDAINDFSSDILKYPNTFYYESLDKFKKNETHIKNLFSCFLTLVLNDGYEGLMFKDSNSTYSFKRSKTWIKYKPTTTYDLKIVDVHKGSGKFENTMGCVECRGLTDDGDVIMCNVGSGFTDDTRDWIYKNKRDVVGMFIEVECQSVTKNSKNSTVSLRNPVFKNFRLDKCNIL